MSWNDDLLKLEQETELAEGDRIARRNRVALRFLEEEARPLLERTAAALGEHGYKTAIEPPPIAGSTDRVMLEVRNGSQSVRLARSPVAFRLVLSPEGQMVVDFWRPFNDEQHIATAFGFFSGDRLRAGLGGVRK